jgi:hypothetical protein
MRRAWGRRGLSVQRVGNAAEAVFESRHSSTSPRHVRGLLDRCSNALRHVPEGPMKVGMIALFH